MFRSPRRCQRRSPMTSRRLALVLALVLAIGGSVGCASHAPSSLVTTEGRAAWSADQVVQRLGEFQNVIIDGQRAGRVKLSDARAIVAWISGDANATPPTQGALDLLS